MLLSALLCAAVGGCASKGSGETASPEPPEMAGAEPPEAPAAATAPPPRPRGSRSAPPATPPPPATTIGEPGRGDPTIGQAASGSRRGDPAATSGTTPDGLRFVKVYYGTNRRRAGECDTVATATTAAATAAPCRPAAFYTGTPARATPLRADELEVGEFRVTFPPGHRTGDIERPLTVPILSITFRDEDPRRDVVISDLATSGSDYDAWARDVRATGKQQAFIYVHGYATTFADAARRAAQMAYDLDLDVGFGGLPMLYSWPSRGTTSGYVLDYDTSLDATDAFNRFLDVVKTRAGVKRVHVIAHSMGNQLVANALRERAWQRADDRPIDQLVLAAPDIWADRFRDRFLATLPRLARRVTLYVSDHDRALKASMQLRAGNARAGLLEGGLIDVVAPGFDVVDATALPADFLDHSYYANNESMLADMYCLLKGSPAGKRPLLQGAGVNWRFRGRGELATLKANACVVEEGESDESDLANAAATPDGPRPPAGPPGRFPWWPIGGGLTAMALAAAAALAMRRRRAARDR